jgi:uncharacterized membrane protein (UPF0127 family)
MDKQRDALVWVLVGFTLLLVGAAAFYTLWPNVQPHVTVKIGDGVYKADVAKTNAERTKGLSGTSSLRNDQALLLVYESDDKWPIWMKDMNYPIDILWLDSDKRVIYIVKNAPPDSYPDEQFVPKKDARYVLELPAGSVSEKNIAINLQATFDETSLEGWWK